MQGSVPLVDMQIGGHVCGQTRGRRGPSHGLQGEVVGGSLLHVHVPLHAHIPEVEALGAEGVGAKQGLRGRQIASVAPGTRNWRRVHGSQRRRHLHDGGWGSEVGGRWSSAVVLGNCCGNERWRAVVFHTATADGAGNWRAEVQPISI